MELISTNDTDECLEKPGVEPPTLIGKLVLNCLNLIQLYV